jgi:hypothetical protein
VAELVDKIWFLGARGDAVMLKKTLLITLVGIGAASITAPAFADVGLFFNNGQGYYGQNYYGLYPFSTLPYYDPYNQPYDSYDPEADAPYAYRSYHYHPQYTGYSYRQCARFHTYNPVTHTYIGKDGLPHHC